MRTRMWRWITATMMAAMLFALPATTAGATGMIARVAGGGILVDGNGFYAGEMIQLIGIRYDGSTLPFGNATANGAGGFSATLAYADTALYQIDARGYGSGAHAVTNIQGALPYPVVPPGYPYVTPTYPQYIVGVTGPYGYMGGYPSTGYPYTGAPYGGPYPGPGYNYPVPPSGVVLVPAIPPGGDNPPGSSNPPQT